MFIPLMNMMNMLNFHLMKVKHICNWCPEDRWVNAFQNWDPEAFYFFFLAFTVFKTNEASKPPQTHPKTLLEVKSQKVRIQKSKEKWKWWF